MPGYLALHDPELRIRRSVERPALFILERRCRRRPAVHTGLGNTTDIHVQARDGYIHVARVHPAWLIRPWNIIRALHEEGADLFAVGASKFADEIEYEDWWQKETRRRRRKNDFRQRALEMYDLAARAGDKTTKKERTRFNNPGMPKPRQTRATSPTARRNARRAARKAPVAARGPVTLT